MIGIVIQPLCWHFAGHAEMMVRKLDFQYFDNLYDLRIVLEIAAIERLCQIPEYPEQLLELKKVWLVPKEGREKDGRLMPQLDEGFHSILVSAAGNDDMAAVHVTLAEKIRIMRRFDFTQDSRNEATYQEHGKILQLLPRRKLAKASMPLRSHIQQSKLEMRKITLHRLHEARELN
jgi:DNA-binding GntR family transcriptional regulator